MVRSLIVRSVIIVACAVLFGGIFNFFSPNGIAWVRDWGSRLMHQAMEKGLEPVTLEQMIQFTSQGSDVLILDARIIELYDQGHIPYAFSAPVKSLNESLLSIQSLAMPEDKLVVYCSGHLCDESVRLGEALRQHGYQKVMIFLGGFDEWKAGSQPIE
jgi:rhodanese-related sulfurtransferase